LVAISADFHFSFPIILVGRFSLSSACSPTSTQLQIGPQRNLSLAIRRRFIELAGLEICKIHVFRSIFDLIPL
jgi:hypothetical protein